jgi:hypothetical protein
VLAKARAEMEKAKADAIESASNEFFNNTDSGIYLSGAEKAIVFPP